MDQDDRGTAAAGAKLLSGRYRLGSLLGRGASSRGYEAVDVTLGRVVAVKVFQPGDNATSRYRFAAEARMLGGLCHPGLVTIHDVCSSTRPVTATSPTSASPEHSKRLT